MDADHRLPRKEDPASSAAVEQCLIVTPIVPLILVTQVVQRNALYGVPKYENSYGWLPIVGAIPVGRSLQSLPDEISQLAALADELPLWCSLLLPYSW